MKVSREILLESVKEDIKSSTKFINNLTEYVRLVKELPRCDSIRNKDLKQYIFDLKIIQTQLDQMVKGFIDDDSSNQLYLQCLVNDIIHHSKQNSLATKPIDIDIVSKRIESFFHLYKIGEGSSGTAYTVMLKHAGSKQKTPFAVLKTTDENSLIADSIHEITVGFILNKIRDRVPNFMYTYGGFLCDTNLGTNDKLDGLKCKDSCNPNEVKAFSFIEYIPGKNILEISEKVSKKLLVKHIRYIMIQVAHALTIAQEQFKFVHYDLHHENVICKESYPQTITCKGKGYNITLYDVKYIPFIIDFGCSACKTDKGLFLPNTFYQDDDDKMVFLGSSEKEFFVSGYDIFRYAFFTCFHIYDTTEIELIADLFDIALDPFKGKINQLKSGLKKVLKDFVKTKDLSSLIDDCDTEKYNESCWFSSKKDKEFFNISMSEWINHMYKETEKLI